MHGLDQQSKGALQLLNDGLGQDSELNIRMLVVQVLGQFGNALCVGLRLEAEPLALQKGLQLLVVGDNAVVDDREFPRGIRPEEPEMVSNPARLC